MIVAPGLMSRGFQSLEVAAAHLPGPPGSAAAALGPSVRQRCRSFAYDLLGLHLARTRSSPNLSDTPNFALSASPLNNLRRPVIGQGARRLDNQAPERQQ